VRYGASYPIFASRAGRRVKFGSATSPNGVTSCSVEGEEVEEEYEPDVALPEAVLARPVRQVPHDAFAERIEDLLRVQHLPIRPRA
jgi:hypothetical protein